jgi:hypothetical protein
MILDIRLDFKPISNMWPPKNSNRIFTWNSVKKSGLPKQNSRNMTTETEQSETESKNRTKDSQNSKDRVRQPEQERQDRTTRRGHSRQDGHNRTGRTEQPRPAVRTGLTGQDKTGQPIQDNMKRRP